jgi:YggT family protein
VREVLCLVVSLYIVALLLRIVLSWFPLNPYGFMGRASMVLVRVTDPVLAPVRRVVPPVGRIDLSPLIVLLVLQIVVLNILLRCNGFL